MARSFSLRALFVTICACFALLIIQPARAAEKTTFNVAWSIYVGWMPWDYAQQSGILKKWADKYGLTINLTQSIGRTFTYTVKRGALPDSEIVCKAPGDAKGDPC